VPGELARPGVRPSGLRRLTFAAVATLGVIALVLGGFGFPTARNDTRSIPRASIPGFNPISFSFDSAANGWVIGIASCVEELGCLALRETRDRGRTWSSRPLPMALVALSNKNTSGSAFDRDDYLSVFFADSEDGWIYGLERERPVFFATHDGGAQWRRLSTSLEGPNGFIDDIASLRGTAYFVAQSNSYHGVLESSPVGRDDWQRVPTPTLPLPAGGAIGSGSIVFKGNSGWLVVGNDRGVSGGAELTPRGQWVKWSPPCASVGDSYVVPVPITSRDLVVTCQMGGFASPLSPSAPPGAKLQSNWLYTSHNGGRTFQYGPQLSRFLENVLAATTSSDLFADRIINSVTDYQQFVRSVDGGRHWTIIRREWALSVAFQNDEQGVAVLQGAHDVNTMVMTSDGGDHWTSITP
jgi:hypothetical protein